jgi:hypothetical protein
MERKGPSHRPKNHYQHRVVLIGTVKQKYVQGDKKIFLTDVVASTKRNLSLVGGCTDTPVDLVIIRNGLPPALVDDPLFRKTLVTTSHHHVPL